jgi:hypothetical protein
MGRFSVHFVLAPIGGDEKAFSIVDEKAFSTVIEKLLKKNVLKKISKVDNYEKLSL